MYAKWLKWMYMLHMLLNGNKNVKKKNIYISYAPSAASAGHNSDGKFIARAQRIEFDCELIPRRVAIFIEKSKDGQVIPVPNVVVRDVACGGNHTVRK